MFKGVLKEAFSSFINFYSCQWIFLKACKNGKTRSKSSGKKKTSIGNHYKQSALQKYFKLLNLFIFKNDFI